MTCFKQARQTVPKVSHHPYTLEMSQTPCGSETSQEKGSQAGKSLDPKRQCHDSGNQAKTTDTSVFDREEQPRLYTVAWQNVPEVIETGLFTKIEEVMEMVRQENLSIINRKKQIFTGFYDILKCFKEIAFTTVEKMARSASEVNNFERRLKRLEAAEQSGVSFLDNLVKDIKINERKRSAELQHLKTQVKTLTSQVQDLQDLGKTSEKLNRRMDTLEARSIAQEGVTRSLEELSARVAIAESSVKRSSKSRNAEKFKRRELEDRVSALEANRIKDQKVYAQKAGKITNELDNLKTKGVELSRVVQEHVAKDQRSRVGFQALYETPSSFPIFKKGNIVQDFTKVVYNGGSHYNPASGQFKAPQDGQYLVSLTIQQARIGVIEAHVVHEASSATSEKGVCKCKTVRVQTNDCAISIVNMTKGDTLVVKIHDSVGDVMLAPNLSSFSCCLVD